MPALRAYDMGSRYRTSSDGTTLGKPATFFHDAKRRHIRRNLILEATYRRQALFAAGKLLFM